MTAQQLKNSILQMAVQGKLVPQDPNDEPASVLLERIRAEKEQLIKEKKIRKEKNPSIIFRGADNLPYEKVGKNKPVCIADEVPFEIPDSWEWARLGTVLHKLTDGTHSRPKYVDSGIPFVSVKDISSGKLDFSNCKYITEQEHKELYNRCNPEYGDILLSKVGTTGIPVIVDCNDQFSLFVSVALLKFNQNLLDKEYLKFLICSPLVQKQATENTRGVGNKNWVMRDIANTLIAIPPLFEQKRIVEKIHTMQPFISRYDIVYKKIDYLNTTFPNNLKKSILQWAVQGKLVPQDPTDEPASILLERIQEEKQKLIREGKIKKDKHESIIFRRDNSHYEKLDGVERCIDDELPFEIPESWCWCRLKSIVNVVSARRVHQSDWRSEGVPFYRAREIGKLADTGFVDNELYISEALYTKLSSSGVPHGGDLMVTAVGTLGKTYIVKGDDRFYYKDASVICFENFSKVVPAYLKILMCSPYMEDQIKQNSSGTTVSTITIVKANEYLIPLPPLKEQKRISDQIDYLQQYINNL